MSESNKRSPIWLLYTVVNAESAKCNICKQTLSYKSSVSNLKKHMNRKHPTVVIPGSRNVDENIGILSEIDNIQEPSGSTSTSTSTCTSADPQMRSSASASGVNIPVNPAKRKRQETVTAYMHPKMTMSSKKRINDQLLGLFTTDFQPFSIVEDRGFKKFVHALNPSYELPNRHTISKSLIPALYETSLTAAKEQVGKALKVCITTDCWTSMNNDSFMGVTAHYIDNDFKMKSVLLSCAVFEKSHSGLNLARKLSDIIKEWGLEKKVIMAISDNASNITNAISVHLKWKHFGCFAHTLNLTVQDSLSCERMEEIIGKVKTIVSHFKRSTKSNAKLMAYQKQAGTEMPKKVIQDVVTRWNSTFYMLKRFIELEDAIRSTVGFLSESLPQLAEEEWSTLKEVCQILSPFEDATRIVSGENYISGSLVIVLKRGLLDVCDKLELENFSDISKKLITSLSTGLSKRLGNVEYSNSLALCTFLDPRFKTFAFKNNDAVESIKKHTINAVFELMSKDLREETGMVNKEQSEPCEGSTSHLKPKFSLWDSVDESLSKNKPKHSTSAKSIVEVQRYLDDEILDRGKNPLEWWKENEYKYPYLSKLVRHRCCVLATSVPCERLFSKAGNILNERRTRLSARKVEQLLFLNTFFQQE